MKKVKLTCIECPLGCDIAVELDGYVVLSVTGNSCPRGAKYAENEILCPRRVLTTTVKTQSEKMLPVKSREPIEKGLLFSAMEHLNSIVVKNPIRIGDVVAIFDGVEIIACMDVD